MQLIELIPSKCVGCRLCELVCSLSHEGECSTAKSRIKVFRDEEFGNNVISICLQCDDAPCVTSCTYGVLIRDEETGVVSFEENLCTGCGDCITACPVGAITLDTATNIVFKCDMCGGKPECVDICPREALLLKEVDPSALERKLLREETFQLLQQRQSTIKKEM